MQFRNVTLGDVQSAIARANTRHGYDLYFDGSSTRSGRILPVSGSSKGFRRGFKGQRIHAACWHAFRDVFIELFEACPDARVVTAMADYRGKESFEESFAATGDRMTTQGGRRTPYRALCDCEINALEASF